MKIVRQIVVDDIPDVDDGMVLRERLVNVMVSGGYASFLAHNLEGELRNTSFVLNGAFDWTIGKDASGAVLLIPLRKEKA